MVKSNTVYDKIYCGTITDTESCLKKHQRIDFVVDIIQVFNMIVHPNIKDLSDICDMQL